MLRLEEALRAEGGEDNPTPASEKVKQMAEKKEPDKEQTEPDQTEKKPKKRRLFTVKGLVFVALAVILVPCAGLLVRGSRLAGGDSQAGQEVSLGRFHYVGDNSPDSRVARAQFNLHIGLLTEVDRAGRARLKMHRYKVQQDVEELLRQAHGGDFEDPTLTELKRQIQETINLTLGKRVIADVIITDLAIERSAPKDAPGAEDVEQVRAEDPSPAEAVPVAPWREKEPA